MATSPYGTRPNDLANPIPSATEAALQPLPPTAPAAAAPADAPQAQGDSSLPLAVPETQQPGVIAQASNPQPQAAAKFDPNQPFEKVDAASLQKFDPNQPFEKVDDAPTSTTGKVIDGGSRVLDYGGGFVRGGLAEVAGGITGKGSIVTPDDLDKMVKGKGPNSAEYLRRLGVDEGVNGDLPLIGHVSQRGAEGFALDVLTDPITIIGRAAKGLSASFPMVKEVLGLGANATAEKIGEMIYKSGFSQIDAKMVENGSRPLSETLLQEANVPAGTTSKIATQVQQIATTMGKMRDGLYQKATDLGVTVDLAHPLEKAEGFVKGLLDDKRASVRAQGAELMKYLQEDFKNAGAVDLPTLSQWKTDLYNTLPKSFFQPNGKMTSLGKQFNAFLANDFKTAIVEAGNTAEKGLGDSIEAINSKWGTLLNSAKPVAQQVKRAATMKGPGAVTAAVVASGHPGIAAAMEGAKLAKTTAVQTTVGKTLMSAGKSGIAGGIARQGLADTQRPPEIQDEEAQ